jgi:hypothetical protein
MHANFPLQDAISNEIDIPTFIHSHTIQPLLYIRIRPWQKEKVVAALLAVDRQFWVVLEQAAKVGRQQRQFLLLSRRGTRSNFQSFCVL